MRPVEHWPMANDILAYGFLYSMLSFNQILVMLSGFGIFPTILLPFVPVLSQCHVYICTYIVDGH